MWVDTSYDNDPAGARTRPRAGRRTAEPTLVYGWRFR